jgi:hypothetical protein
MARIRSIHPGWFTDEAWVSVSMPARILGIGLLTESDDCGAFEWKPLTLKMRLFPADSVNVTDLLAELEGAGLIKRYEHGARHYGLVRNFMRFQRPKKPKSVHFIPEALRHFVGIAPDDAEPDVEYRDSVPTFSEPTRVDAPSVPRSSEIVPQMEDGGWRMEDEDIEAGASISRKRARQSVADERFSEFWAAYPRKADKRKAEKAWVAAIKRADLEVIIRGAIAYAGERSGKDPAYTKHPTTWLNADAWANDPEPDHVRITDHDPHSRRSDRRRAGGILAAVADLEAADRRHADFGDGG